MKGLWALFGTRPHADVGGRARRRASERAGVWHESLAASCFHLIYSLSNTMQPAKRERESRMLSFLLLCLRNGRKKKEKRTLSAFAFVRFRSESRSVAALTPLEDVDRPRFLILTIRGMFRFPCPQTLNRRMHAFKKENRSA